MHFLKVVTNGTKLRELKDLNDTSNCATQMCLEYSTSDKINCNNCPSELLFSVLGESGSGFRYPTSDLYFINDLHGWAITGHGEKHGGGSSVSEISELMYYYGDPSNSYGGPAFYYFETPFQNIYNKVYAKWDRSAPSGDFTAVNLILIGQDGKILKSSSFELAMANTGTFTPPDSWTVLSSGTTENLNNIKFLDDDTGIIVGDNGTILISNDGGETWSSMNSGVDENLNTIDFGGCAQHISVEIMVLY